MSRRTQCAALSVILHGYILVLLPSHHLALASPTPPPAALDTVAVDPLPAPARDPNPPPQSTPPEHLTDAPVMDLSHPAPHPIPRALPGARPPLAARASAVLTQEPTTPAAPATPFVTGLAPTFPGGVTQANAQGTVAQDDLDAREWGEPGGTGTGGGGFGSDLSRPAALGGPKEWHCPFPPEGAAIDHTWARIIVFVEADGRPHHVVVQEDPGTGFGREAVACAMKEHYVPARNRDGHPARGRTLPFRVYFDRW